MPASDVLSDVTSDVNSSMEIHPCAVNNITVNHQSSSSSSASSSSAGQSQHPSSPARQMCLPQESMLKKLVITVQRHRRHVNVIIYVTTVTLLGFLLIRPELLDDVIFAPAMPSSWSQTKMADASAAIRKGTVQTVQKVFDLPFVPRDFLCDEMHERSRRNFPYPEGYTDHADAYKSALTLNNIVEEGATNEQAWLLVELAQLPFVRTVCETGFHAGNHAFQFLTANFDLVVHSFENLRRFNFTLEMSDFMIIEFPDRFFIYDGSPSESIPKFFTSEQGNKTLCDVILIDSSQELDVIRKYFQLFHQRSNRVENLVIINAHPLNVVKNSHGADKVWDEMKRDKLISEHFRCYFEERDLSANQKGLLVGSFLF